MDVSNALQFIDEDAGYCCLPSRLVRFDDIIVEKNECAIRPDIIGIIGDKKLFIEVAVTHFIDDDKLNKIRKINIPTIEIVFDSTTQLDWESLQNVVINSVKGKYWKHNSRAEAKADESQRFRAQAFLIKQHTADQFRQWENERDRVTTHMIAYTKSGQEGYGSKIVVRFLPSHVSIMSEPYDGSLTKKIKAISNQFSGKFNADRHQFEIQSSIENYIAVAAAVKNSGFSLASASKENFTKNVIDRIGYSFSARDRFIIMKKFESFKDLKEI